MNWTLLLNSLLVSGFTTLLAVMFGFLGALWLAGLARPWRLRWLGVAIATLCLPPFLATNCWLHYLGLEGVWHRWLPLKIYSLPGTVWVLTLLLWPIPLLATLGAWQRLEAGQMESDPAVTGRHLVRGLLLPLARGALGQAAVLTFVLALNNFAVPAILQVKVFPAEVWVQFNTTFNTAAALWTSWPMVVAPLLLLLFLRHRATAWPRVEGTASARLFRHQLGRGWFWGCGGVTILLGALSLGLPVWQLVSSRRTWLELPGALAAGQEAIWHSVIFSAATATLCLVIGLLAVRLPLGTVLWVPFLVPGVLLGIGIIAVFNRPLFSAFYQSVGIVILVLTIRYLAFAWQGVSHAWRQTDPDLTDFARLEGASRWQIFRLVHWPQIAAPAALVWQVIFLLCLWDVESLVLIVPPGGETVALRVFNLLHYGRNPQVNALCLTLLVLALLPLALGWMGHLGLQLWRSRTMAGVFGLALLGLTGCSPGGRADLNLDSKLFSRVEIIGTRGAGVGQFNKPRSVAVDREDNLYVVDMTGRVQKFSPKGQFLLQWQMPQTDLGKAKGMGLDQSGNLIVVEPHYQRLNHFATTGKLLSQWGVKGTNAGQLIMPRSVAVDSHGGIYTSEYTLVERVQEFSPDGKTLLKCFGQAGTGNGEFNRPEGLGLDAQDRLYVADSCNHRIQVFGPDGHWLRTYGHAGKGPGDLSYPYDIRVDSQGRQYVCEFGNSRIQIFDAQDHPVEILGHAGGAPGEFSNPWGIALDSHGNLYVADSQNHRVQKFLRRQPYAAAAIPPAGVPD